MSEWVHRRKPQIHTYIHLYKNSHILCLHTRAYMCTLWEVWNKNLCKIVVCSCSRCVCYCWCFFSTVRNDIAAGACPICSINVWLKKVNIIKLDRSLFSHQFSNYNLQQHKNSNNKSIRLNQWNKNNNNINNWISFVEPMFKVYIIYKTKIAVCVHALWFLGMFQRAMNDYSTVDLKVKLILWLVLLLLLLWFCLYSNSVVCCFCRCWWWVSWCSLLLHLLLLCCSFVILLLIQ